jgi:hypothetical protein
MEEALLKELELLNEQIEKTVEEVPEDQEETEIFEQKSETNSIEK